MSEGGSDVQKTCVNEWVNACSKEGQNTKGQTKGREERVKINGRQVLGVMHTTCKMFRNRVVGEKWE